MTSRPMVVNPADFLWPPPVVNFQNVAVANVHSESEQKFRGPKSSVRLVVFRVEIEAEWFCEGEVSEPDLPTR